jgi:hypothetical protein
MLQLFHLSKLEVFKVLPGRLYISILGCIVGSSNAVLLSIFTTSHSHDVGKEAALVEILTMVQLFCQIHRVLYWVHLQGNFIYPINQL